MAYIHLNTYFVPDWIVDSHEAIQRSEDNPISRGDEKTQRESSEPNATQELVSDVAACHTSSIDVDRSGQQREERSKYVQYALVNDQNVIRLNGKQ